ncbi:Os08g0234050, partial [Oryza sativa Japonica Group]
QKKSLVHPPDELVDVVLTVAGITTLDIVVPLLLEATEWCLQLEGPQEVVGLLEVWTDSHDLVDKILNADDPTRANIPPQ